jgi:hypothetical protein
VFVNGVLQEPGSSADYTISGGTITFNSAPQSPWTVFVNYTTGGFAPIVTGGSKVAVPASASSAGQVGNIAWDSSYFYVCVSTNTWVRSSLSTW